MSSECVRGFSIRTSLSLNTKEALVLEELRADFPILNQSVHRNRPLVFFDNAASTQRPDAVLNAMDDLYHRDYSNVHRGVHALSQAASEHYENARQLVADFVNAARASEIVFTSGTTAGVNLVARSWGDSNVSRGDEILLTEMEHHSNIVPWQQLAERVGCRIRFLPMDDHGELELDQLQEFITPATKLVAFTAISNVLGTINPVREVTEAAHQVGAKVLVDAAQQVPHDVTDVQAWDADFVVWSGHKMLGPTGIGVLWGRGEVLETMQPFLGGGSMISQVTQGGYIPSPVPTRFEAGTPPIAEAVGLAAAIEYLTKLGMQQVWEHELMLMRRAMERLEAIPRVNILGPGADKRAGIVSFTVDGANSQDVSQFLDLRGYATRAGHHCAMPLHERLGVPSSCRASFYLYNTEAEVDAFADTLSDVIDRVG